MIIDSYQTIKQLVINASNRHSKPDRKFTTRIAKTRNTYLIDRHQADWLSRIRNNCIHCLLIHLFMIQDHFNSIFIDSFQILASGINSC